MNVCVLGIELTFSRPLPLAGIGDTGGTDKLERMLSEFWRESGCLMSERTILRVMFER